MARLSPITFSPWRIVLIACLGAVLSLPYHQSHADPARIVLKWNVPPPQARREPDGSLTLFIPGYLVDERPGAPRLPYTSTLIALPPMANPTLRVTRLETITLSLRDYPDLLSSALETDAPTPHSDPWQGSVPIFMHEIGTMRGIRLALVVFRPIWLRGDRLEMARHARAEIEISPPPLPSSTLDSLQRQIARHVLNPAQAIPDRPDRFLQDQDLSILSIRTQIAATQAFIEVDRPGIYRLRYEDLSAIGMGDADPSSIRLFRGLDEVTYIWQGDEDSTFEPGEAILFYAEPRSSRWTSVDVYRLTAGFGQRLPPRQRPAHPLGSLSPGRVWARMLAEENRLYMPDRFTPNLPPGRDGDQWAWDYLSGPAQSATPYTFALSDVHPEQDATITLWLIGHTSTSHRWKVQINSAFIGEAIWSGKTAVTVTFSIPSGILRAGTNNLYLQPLIAEGGWLDAFEIRYVRAVSPIADFILIEGEANPHSYALPVSDPGQPPVVLDVTDPLSPTLLIGVSADAGQITFADPPDSGGRRYAIAPVQAIRSPLRIRPPHPLFLDPPAPSSADLVIITHPDFAEALSPLRDLRREQGLQVAVINVLGIYDTYGDGRMDPEAIRRFIGDIYVHWNPRPTYVLLVGDGSFDPKRYQPGSPPTYIPPYLANVDPAGGETAADNRYVTVDGEDNLPDLIIGRIPAKTREELTRAVTKIIAYEVSHFPGEWNTRVILVADDADSAGNFPSISEASAAFLPPSYVPVRLYCNGSSSAISDCAVQETANIRGRLLSEWNTGALIIQFAGHSSWQQWAHERFFHLDDLPNLHNDRRWPVVLGMTCFTGAFHRPEPTLDEELMLHPAGGAIATWGSTGLGISRGHDWLSQGFFESVFVRQAATVGEATLEGKIRLLEIGQHLDLLDTFVLLGDPATRIDRTIVPWASRVYLPLVLR